MTIDVYSDEGLYFLGAKEISQEEIDKICAGLGEPPFILSALPATMKWIKEDCRYRLEETSPFEEESAEDEAPPKEVSSAEFESLSSKTKSILYYADHRRLVDLELSLENSRAWLDAFREVLQQIKPTLFIEKWDSTIFYSGPSFMTWLTQKFPTEGPAKKGSLEPIKSIDLLSDFLFENADDLERSYAMREAIQQMTDNDQRLLEKLLNGKTDLKPGDIERESVRLLKAIKERVL